MTPGVVQRSAYGQSGGRWLPAILFCLAAATAIYVYGQHAVGARSGQATPAGVGAGSATQTDQVGAEASPEQSLPAYAIDPNTGRAIWLGPGGLSAKPAQPGLTSGDILCPDGSECPPSK